MSSAIDCGLAAAFNDHVAFLSSRDSMRQADPAWQLDEEKGAWEYLGSDEDMQRALATEAQALKGSHDRNAPRTRTLAEIRAGADRASERFEGWPAWKREVSEPLAFVYVAQSGDQVLGVTDDLRIAIGMVAEEIDCTHPHEQWRLERYRFSWPSYMYWPKEGRVQIARLPVQRMGEI